MPAPRFGHRGVSLGHSGEQVPSFSPGSLSEAVSFPQAFSQIMLLPCRVHILLPQATDTPAPGEGQLYCFSSLGL